MMIGRHVPPMPPPKNKFEHINHRLHGSSSSSAAASASWFINNNLVIQSGALRPPFLMAAQESKHVQTMQLQRQLRKKHISSCLTSRQTPHKRVHDTAGPQTKNTGIRLLPSLAYLNLGNPNRILNHNLS